MPIPANICGAAWQGIPCEQNVEREIWYKNARIGEICVPIVVEHDILIFVAVGEYPEGLDGDLRLQKFDEAFLVIMPERDEDLLSVFEYCARQGQLVVSLPQYSSL